MIVLDTHALVWWVNGDQESLSSNALEAINRELDSGIIIVSSISAWELAMLVAKDRLALSMDVTQWLEAVDEIEAVTFTPIDNAVAVMSTMLPGEFHKDPADRMIVATARQLAAPIVTADEKISRYPHVATIW